MLDLLNRDNSEQQMLENLLEAVYENTGEQVKIAAEIMALRRLKFSLAKAIKDNDNIRNDIRANNSKTLPEGAKA